ncbi:MAG TPA: S8 family serine peptidase [Bacteroidales bacterium]|nr:S8 family serine peptidase [Bacteroidales bacterium]
MKNFVLAFVLLIISSVSFSQEYYWVYLTDKQGTKFDPYEYFDQKAIDRRIKNGISLYDISDYPINEKYKTELSLYANEVIGESRWFNAVAIYASEENIKKIANLSFVKNTVAIHNDMLLSEYDEETESVDKLLEGNLRPQLSRMGGENFVNLNINGKGIRIAVFDGGFPGVDTHGAFEHLRNGNLIKKTWNFPNKKEDVYGWDTHGTMVLSCIAGIAAGGDNIGLATGSEFLLARTEVGAEPAREEVWWMMAVEWADKNGADIINSSLGYGADRHRTKDMDGQTCLVTRAANMAASKGILVCNAMGNEGDDKSWITLGAPADADSILSVGGIEPSSDFHISFSSFGPTADGRLKPNVVAFGYAMVAQKDGVAYAYGTSFASPLVAGFVACAWQSRPGLTAMQMKAEIEKSGDNYPYYDYAIGYGVPQASYFIMDPLHKEKTFVISEDDEMIIITPIKTDEENEQKLYYHIRTDDGIIEFYEHIEFYHQSEKKDIKIKKSALYGSKILAVHSNGYTEEYKSNDSKPAEKIIESPTVLNEHYAWLSKIPELDLPKKFGVNAGFYIHPYFSFSNIIPPVPGGYDIKYFNSGSYNLGVRFKQNILKWYSLGVNLDWNTSKLRLKDFTDWQTVYDYSEYKAKEKFSYGGLCLEFYQRFRLLPSGMFGFGLFWDIGIYGQWIVGASYDYKYETEKIVIKSSEPYTGYEKFHYGIRTRIGYGVLSAYAQYRLSDFVLDVYEIPKLEAGFELAIPVSM